MRLITKVVGIVAIISVMFHILAVVSHSMASPDINKPDINKEDHQTGMNTHVHDVLSKLPLYFIQNMGQVDKKIRYYERGSGHATFLAEDGIHLILDRGKTSPVISPQNDPQSALIKLSFIGADKNLDILSEGLQEHRVNYFIGNDPAGWKTNIPTYSAVVFKEVYPGIDIKFYGTDRQLEYDVTVKPGADPAKIRMALEGVEGLRVMENSEMEIRLKEGKLFQKKPYIYQEIDGKRVEVAGSFRLLRPEHPDKDLSAYGFEVAGYDKRYPLVIDPILDYSTYLGGSAYDDGHGITLDSDGNAYVVGDTASTNFPTYAPFQATNSGSDDVFVTKINPSGTALVFSTYIGGSTNDDGRDIAVDASGNVYITGITESNNFPVNLPLYGSNSGMSDAFVTKLNSLGNALVYSTYLGGSSQDTGRGIGVDSGGNAYVTGETKSNNFPTTSGAYGISYGGVGDSFVTKLNAAGNALVYSTYLGGSDQDAGRGIGVDSGGNAYVTGETKSNNFPTTSGAYDTSYGGQDDVFVTKLNSVGNGLVYSTYLGGSGIDGSFVDRGRNLTIDSDGNAYITGDTSSSDFPTTLGAYDTSYGGQGDSFVTKLNSVGTGLVYSTYLGGSGKDQSPSIAIDSVGNAYVTGQTDSTDFPVLSPPAQGTYAGGLWDAFVTSVSASGSSLVYSTYLGGSLEDQGLAIASAPSGRVCITGRTISTNFPTGTSPIQGTFGGGVWDAFVTCIGSPLTYTLSVINAGTGSGTVTSSPAGINCVGDCSEVYNYGTVVTLTATPAMGSVFAGWSGDADCLDGVVTVDSAKSCTATFNLQTYTLTVINAGTGSGTVTSSPAGINCVGDCSEVYNYGTSVTLTATPATGSVFAGWSGGGCSGTGTTCVVTMDAAKTVTATFNTGTISADLSITKTDSPDPVSLVGANLTYTITVTNNGPSAANGVTVTDTLPTTQVSFVSVSTTQGSCTGTSTISCTIGALSNGATATVTIVVQTLTAAMVGNTATVSGNETDPDSVNNSATATTNVGDLSRLLAISTRLYVGTGDNIAIGGFWVGGNVPKKILIRGQGPSLVDSGISGDIVMTNPYLELYSGSAVIAQNDNWQTTDSLCASPATVCGNAADIQATGMDPCSSGPTNCTWESAVLVTVPPGPYTAKVKGVGGGTGVGIVEVFDVDNTTLEKMVGISTRGLVLTGDSIMIGGFWVGAGTGNKKVLIRAQGPSLVDSGISGDIVMTNPYLQLYSGSAVIAQNDNWQTTDSLCASPATACGNAADIQATGMDPCSSGPTNCTWESAVLVTVPPGPYTAKVKGVGGGTGVGMVEIYEVP